MFVLEDFSQHVKDMRVIPSQLNDQYVSCTRDTWAMWFDVNSQMYQFVTKTFSKKNWSFSQNLAERVTLWPMPITCLFDESLTIDHSKRLIDQNQNRWGTQLEQLISGKPSWDIHGLFGG
jgi:hypothetical protein